MINNTSKYCIIAGTTKSATTSLFSYLEKHPNICGSAVKETRFFLCDDYPIPEYAANEKRPIFDEYFPNCEENKIKLEATPDYLYSSGTPEKISSTLEAVKIIFILRDPIARLESWYQFAKQTGRISEKLTFAQYINYQLEDRILPNEQHWYSLEQGLYSKYLPSFFDSFGQENVLILWYEDLKKSPYEFMEKVSEFLTIDSSFYNDFFFEPKNITRKARWPWFNQKYISISDKLRMATITKPILRKILKNIKFYLDKFYQKLNYTSFKKSYIDDQTLGRVREYYKDEIKRIESFGYGIPPWLE